MLLVGSAALFLVRYRVYDVPTTSMTPTIEPGDRIVVDAWSRGAARGDVVLAEVGGRQLVKRVAATAGDTATCCDAAGRVQVNGVALAGVSSTSFSVRVAPGHLFLLGDNLATSVDSRADGAVPTSAVRGRVVALAFPARAFPDRAAPALRATVGAGLTGLALVLTAGLLALRPRRRATAPPPNDPTPQAKNCPPPARERTPPTEG